MVLGIQIWLALALGPVVLAATPLVTAEGDCPDADAVRARYEQLGSNYPQPYSDAALPGIAHVALRNGLLEVSLRNESGALVGEREVASTAFEESKEGDARQGVLPAERNLARGVAFEEREGLEHHGHRGGEP